MNEMDNRGGFAGMPSPSLGMGMEVGTMDLNVPSRRSGRVAGGGNNSSINRG